MRSAKSPRIRLCRCRINSPQKCRLNLPQFEALRRSSGARPEDWRRVVVDHPPDGWEEMSVIKLGELMMILDLHRQGLSVSAIARQTGIDRALPLRTGSLEAGVFR